MNNYSIAYTIMLKDKFNRIAKRVNESTKTMKQNINTLGFVVKIVGETALTSFTHKLEQIKAKAKSVGRGLEQFGRSIKKISSKIMDFGKSFSLKVTTPLLIFGGLALRSFNSQAQALEQVKTGIESTGGAAKKSLAELDKQATKLQSQTLFADDSILTGVTAQLLTFSNISSNVFDKAQEAVLDVTTRLYGASAGAETLKATSIQLGKALNDPVANLSALSRSGIQFSEKQKAIIKYFSKTNQLAKAQVLILEEIQKQYGGSARAAARAGTGALTQLLNILDDLMEKIGAIINDALQPFIGIVKRVVESISEWVDTHPKLSKWIVIMSAFIALVGPLAIGIATLASVWGTLTLVLGISLPIIAILAFKILLISAAIVAVGIAIYYLIKYWQDFMAWLRKGLVWFDKLNEKITGFKSTNFASLIDPVITDETQKNINNEIDFNNYFSPVVEEHENNKKNKNMFEGVLKIDIKDKGKNVQNTQITKSGDLKVGFSGVGR